VARVRVTARCEEVDLDAMPPDDASVLLDKFVEMRSQGPDTGDLINDLHERPCHSLHSGRYRAATWYDTEHDVVWLLAAGLHRSGSRDDFYNVAVRIEQAGRLYPTADDYERLVNEALLHQLTQEAKTLQDMREDMVLARTDDKQIYRSEHGLYVELSAEFIDRLAVVAMRILLQRLSGPWLTAAELAILLEGALGTDARPRPDADWLYRSFEAYFPVPSNPS